MINNSYVLIRGVYYRRKQSVSLSAMVRKIWNQDDSIYIQNLPRYIKVFDNGGATLDRYTVIFTKRKVNQSEYLALKLSDEPDGQFHNKHTILLNSTSQKSVPLIGRKIAFTDLPAQCQSIVRKYYRDLWSV